MDSNILIGSHVSMSGKEMLLGSVKEALYRSTTEHKAQGYQGLKY